MNRVLISNPLCGIFHMQVCAEADATDEEILAVCNLENPSGTTNGWTTVIRRDDPEDASEGQTLAPVRCETHPERLHFLVGC
jgi:hypothetical protein